MLDEIQGASQNLDGLDGATYFISNASRSLGKWLSTVGTLQVILIIIFVVLGVISWKAWDYYSKMKDREENKSFKPRFPDI